MGCLQVFSLTVVMATVFVTSNPVYPDVRVPLESMDPTDACLFSCNMCFDKKPKEMMRCVRDVCFDVTANKEKALFWLGKSCVKYPKVSEWVFNSLNDL